jgi:F0F1-type ATP synthase epsilon subunit
MSVKTFHLKVNTPTGILFEDDVLQAELCSSTGYYALLADHAPVIGTLNTSICYIRDQKNNRVKTIVNKGVFQFNENELNIFTDFFCFSDKANEDIFKTRQEKIDQILKQKSNDTVAYNLIQTELKENLSKLKKLANI